MFVNRAVHVYTDDSPPVAREIFMTKWSVSGGNDDRVAVQNDTAFLPDTLTRCNAGHNAASTSVTVSAFSGTGPTPILTAGLTVVTGA